MSGAAEIYFCDKFRHLTDDKEWQSAPQKMLEQEVRRFDAVIFGGGPAGMSAALWCRELGLSAVLVEASNTLGGQLLRTFGAIRNHLGAETRNGREMADGFIGQIQARGLEIVFGAAPNDIDWPRRRIVLSNGMQLSVHGLIIATGVSRRLLGVPGEGRFQDRGELDSGVRNAANLGGKSVVIVGGGDAALENALILSDNNANVTIVHRGNEFRAREEFVRALRDREKIRVLMNSNVVGFSGRDILENVRVSSAAGDLDIAADHVLVRIGVEPNSRPFRDLVTTDLAGYIDVDRDGATSCAGVYAAGDVCHPKSPTVSTAVGSGASTAKALYSCLSEA